MKLLIDECLSEELAHLAIRRGYAESSHVVWLGKRGWQDWNLLPFIVEGDWTFVTRNAYDFRGPAGAPGSPGLHSKAEIHAGLICLTGEVLDLDAQLDLFEAALDDLEADPDLINRVLDVFEEGDQIVLRRYALPEH
ncbi:DUF5615 family PIN-like protein [Caulobacter sp. 17J65-9]|uniref:DUF5615 family PIN-like protein n=1 Tax=Caulobacter sp. 17J65-9 TaxID=2709382 RepID=UPI0013C5ABCE|nr:DUF5615 family PIN-like protein [Caulobacter sp. 17J65-9]NEX91200.1 hypothetical protein [Caulobacter sp. 17J65-9]